MVTVWGERNVYSGNAVKQLLEQLPAIAPAQPASEPPEKKQRIEDEATRPLLEAMFEASRLEILSNKSLVALSQPCRPVGYRHACRLTC